MACSINHTWSQTDIGKRMRMARLRAGLTLAQVGTFLGVTGQQVNKYETGRNTLAATTLAALADLFDVTPGWLLGRGDAVDLQPSIQHAREEARVLEAFAKIERADHRKVALMAVETIASLVVSAGPRVTAGEPRALAAEGMNGSLLPPAGLQIGRTGALRASALEDSHILITKCLRDDLQEGQGPRP